MDVLNFSDILLYNVDLESDKQKLNAKRTVNCSEIYLIIFY